ncbi:hypothetical protein N1851_014048 [Merluccius polli]|uniref:Uncharacterized protein n=1 Tax=Merluccius polli TaxID=89951 RepID=A0AA47MV02_MERPO|nr:hypothetical protein N1851_014048 [Merluccius polli]
MYSYNTPPVAFLGSSDTRHRGTIESLLTGSFTAWYGSCTDKDRKALRRVVRTANNITGCELPSLEDLYTQRCLNIARRIIEDPHPPPQKTVLPSEVQEGERI